MPERDLYEVLGVDRGASQDEIRTAYRALARKLHPDVNKAPDAQQRFTEVQEAYDVLSDENKRRMYDRTGRIGVAGGAPGGAWGGGGGRQDIEFDFDDLGSMFDSFFGGRAAGPRPKARPRPRSGADLRQTVTVGLEDVARGRTVRTTTPAGESVEVKIPGACADGAQLRLRGRGQPSASGGPPGDLLLTVRVRPHPTFTRGRPNAPDPKSPDLSIILRVTIAEATFGATVDVPTLEGPVRLSVPPATASGRQLRLKGRGLTPADGPAGDLYALVRIVPPDPKRLDDADREALERIAAKGPSPRATGADGA